MADSLLEQIEGFIRKQVERSKNDVGYRRPVIGYALASDPRFAELKSLVHSGHLLPEDILPKAKTVVSFFLPFTKALRKANRADPEHVAPEWALAYIRTNALISEITDGLIHMLKASGVRAAAQPPTHNFDPVTLNVQWAHKSVAVIAGIGSFGLHKMVITDAGCLGRFGSLVLDAEIALAIDEPKERCLFMHDGSCGKCVQRCPLGALSKDGLDKQLCYKRLLEVSEEFSHLGYADVCGKCATGPCALASPVKKTA